MRTEAIRELTWKSPELSLVKSSDFPTYYPRIPVTPDIREEIRRIGGDSIERAFLYGSTVSGVAAKDSLMDIFAVVGNAWDFYNRAASREDIRLGTLKDPGFHALWNSRKPNFYLGEIETDYGRQGIKFGVIGHDEFIKHARGGRPDEGKGYLWLSGRLHKAMLVPALIQATRSEKQEIDLAVNQARIDGTWLSLGLMPDYFTFDGIARKYVNLSYAADKRVEKAGKSDSLLDKNYGYYEQMLGSILTCFESEGIIRAVPGEEKVYQKLMSLSEEEVSKWLKQSASYAFKMNFGPNYITMGPLNGIKYGLAKVRRSRQKS